MRPNRPFPGFVRLSIYGVAILAVALAPTTGALAQAPDSPGRLTAADYERAEAFLAQNLATRVFRASVSPDWHSDTRFSYRVRIPGGHEFIRVDAERGTRDRAFDHERLSAALSRATDESFEALQLPFTRFDEEEGAQVIRVQAAGRSWRCDLQAY